MQTNVQPLVGNVPLNTITPINSKLPPAMSGFGTQAPSAGKLLINICYC